MISLVRMGEKTGGLQKTPTWRNCVLTTGEHPIISPSSGAGAVNRTLEIDCHDIHLFDNPKDVAITLYNNFGFAGREFVERLMDEKAIEDARSLQDEMQEALKTEDTMDKQTASAALIMTADRIIERQFFRDGILLQPSDIAPYLVSKQTVNQNARALQYIYDQVNINAGRFSPELSSSGEVWGDQDDQYIYIIKSKFDQLLQDEGYNASAFIGWAKNQGILCCGTDGRPTKVKKILGKSARCVWIKYQKYENQEEISTNDEGYL